MPIDKLIEGDQVVQSLTSSIDQGGISLKHVPGLLKRVIQEDLWMRRKLTGAAARTGEIVEFKGFNDFVTYKQPDGLGTDIKTLERLCADDIEATDLLDQVTTGKHGGDRKSEEYEIKSDNITLDFSDGRGTSQTYALRRLRKKCPDLHTRVLADELTCNQAMIQAGFRLKTLTIPLHPERAAGSIRRHFDADQIKELIRFLVTPEAT